MPVELKCLVVVVKCSSVMAKCLPVIAKYLPVIAKYLPVIAKYLPVIREDGLFRLPAFINSKARSYRGLAYWKAGSSENLPTGEVVHRKTYTSKCFLTIETLSSACQRFPNNPVIVSIRDEVST